MLSLFSFWIPLIIAIIALIKSTNNAVKLDQLEKILAEKNFDLAHTSVVSNASLGESNLHANTVSQAGGVSTVATFEENTVQNDNRSVQAEAEDEFISWLKRDWLLKLGGVLIILGILFFLSIAFVTMGPVGKITTGYMIGISLMSFGFWWAKKYVNGGTSIHVIGALIVILTTYTARTPSYDLFGAATALVLIFVTSVVVSLVSFVYSRKEVAHLALISAAAAPLLISSDSFSFGELLVYLLVVTISVIWLAAVSGWRTLILVSQVSVILYSLPHIGKPIVAPDFLSYALVFIFGIVFLLISVISLVRTNGKTVEVDSIIAALNMVFVSMWIFDSIPKGGQGVMFAFVAFLYSLGAFVVYKFTKNPSSFLVYSILSLALLMTATFVQLTEVARIIALMLEAGLATLFIRKVSGSDTPGVQIVSLFNVLPIIQIATLILFDIHAGASRFTEAVMVTITAIIFYGILASLFMKMKSELGKVFTVLFALISVAFIWQFLHSIMNASSAAFISLVVYTIAGIAILFAGSAKADDELIKVGRFCLGVIALRVLFVDAWLLGSTFIGVLVCIVVGLLLVSTTFITKK